MGLMVWAWTMVAWKAVLVKRGQSRDNACHPEAADFILDATREMLLKAFPQAHLFHFAGHGDFESRLGPTPGTTEGKGVLILDDGYGDPHPIEAGELAVQLRQAGVRVAVLGAC
jgi:hypothetical protein